MLAPLLPPSLPQTLSPSLFPLLSPSLFFNCSHGVAQGLTG